MITRILIVAVLVLSCSLCIAEDAPIDIWDWERTNEIKSLTVEQAAKLVEPGRTAIAPFLQLNGLTSIDKDAAQELVKFKGRNYLELSHKTSIDKEALKILKSNPNIEFVEEYGGY